MTPPIEPSGDTVESPDFDDLVDVLAARLARRSAAKPGPDEDCGLDTDCPPDQICLDGHCT
jgi:hypothetical protein